MKEITTLTPKQEAFCVHYTTIGAETFSNGTRSAIAAGYSEASAYSQASALLKKHEIKERITALHTENMSRNGITVDKVLADLEHDKQQARAAGKYHISKDCAIAQGKYLAMFVDRTVTADLEIKALTEAEEREARRLSSLLLRESIRGLPENTVDEQTNE